MSRNIFTDPKGVRTAYSWQINHSEEDTFGKTRTVEHGANTGNTGLVKQQGDSSPLVIKVKGAILHKAQLEEMIAWWDMCEDQTIYFQDFAGDKYEVLITSFQPVRKRTIRNPRDFANAPLWWWTYDLEMEVVRIIPGLSPWEGVAV